MSSLLKFLQRNTVQPAQNPLPYVHSTQAYHLRKIWQSNAIERSLCDVFVNEKLNYFFVGRPSYKRHTLHQNSEYWELPTCFIMNFNVALNIKRIFPFDSGAHKGGRFPDYISLMEIEEFEVASDPDAPAKIIGAFFGTAVDYFSSRAKSSDKFGSEFALGPFDAEIRALHKLAFESSSTEFDDRRFCIEVQSSDDVPLINNGLLAIVCPQIYLDDTDFRNHVENIWTAQPLSHEIHSLNMNNYISIIYDKVKAFYRDTGLL